MVYTDRSLTCSDCGAEFAFTAGEQEFHASKGFTNQPGRCPSCRAARRSQRESGSYGAPRAMFTATCSSCGNEARIPFQPRNDKPVYCSDCYRARPADNSRGGRW